MGVPAAWLLQRACDGVDLTQTGALSRSVVRDAVEVVPGWWNAEVHGPPYREADVRPLAALHDGLRRARLVRRRGRRLLTTKRGRELLADDDRLGAALLADLDRGDDFEGAVWRLIVQELQTRPSAELDELCGALLVPLERHRLRVRLRGRVARDAHPRELGPRGRRRLPSGGLSARRPTAAVPRPRRRRLSCQTDRPSQPSTDRTTCSASAIACVASAREGGSAQS